MADDAVSGRPGRVAPTRRPWSAALVLAGLLTAGASAAPVWAVGSAGFLLPPRATAFDVGGTLDIDGVPTATLGFVVRQPPAVVAAWVIARWPVAHTDDRVGQRRVLGRIDGHRHLTLVIEPTLDGGTRGLWSSADIRAALRRPAPPTQPPSWSPAGGQTLQRLHGPDAAGGATTWLLRHGQAPQAVAEHLARHLATDGRVLRQRLPAGEGRSAAQWLLFAGPSGEATAVVAPLSGGGSATAVTVGGGGR